MPPMSAHPAYRPVPLQFDRVPRDEQIARARELHERLRTRRTVRHYYVAESVGIASGFLLAALHYAGLATLTHTPSPMAFLSEILGRPRNEKPFLLIPVGYPAPDAVVPDIRKKDMSEVRIDI